MASTFMVGVVIKHSIFCNASPFIAQVAFKNNASQWIVGHSKPYEVDAESLSGTWRDLDPERGCPVVATRLRLP